jgi:hypothetical protein
MASWNLQELRAGEIRGRGPAGELEAPAEDALGIGCSGIEDVDEEDRFGCALQGGRHRRVHCHAERAVIGASLRGRKAGVRADGTRQEVVRVADLDRAHDGDQEDRKQCEPAQPGGLLRGGEAGLEEVSHGSERDKKVDAY